MRIHRARIGANVLPIKMGKLQPFISGLIPVLLVAVSSVSAQIQPGQLAKTPPGQQAKPSDTANPAQLVPQMPPAEAARLYKFPASCVANTCERYASVRCEFSRDACS